MMQNYDDFTTYEYLSLKARTMEILTEMALFRDCLMAELLRKYDPNQLRAPAGTTIGRQWIAEGVEFIDGLADAAQSLLDELKEDLSNYFEEILNNTKKWKNQHFVAHFYVGAGRPVKLEDIGQLESIKSYYNKNYLKRFEKQILEKAKKTPDGAISDSFDATYDFGDVLYSYRKAGVKGKFEGRVRTFANGKRGIAGKLHIEFYDHFKDPLSARQTSVEVLNLNPFTEKVTEEDIKLALAELYGTPYDITEKWEEQIILFAPQATTRDRRKLDKD